jgi:hypothetical protein
MLADPKRLITDLQRQFAECRAKRDQALQREMVTAELLQVINSSPGELAPLFDAVLKNATRLCQATFGVLGTYDGKVLHTVAALGVRPAYGEYLTNNPETPIPGRKR